MSDLPDDLRRARDAFRGKVRADGTTAREFSGRVGIVLSGGGAFGAYEAGALLAFQDAAIPTPIITSTSIGSINAASYAAHGSGVMGNAEPLVRTWLRLSPAAVGIEWIGYASMIAGFAAIIAGLVNLTRLGLEAAGFSLHLHHPVLTWLILVVAGTSVVLLYDRLPYVFDVIRAMFRGRRWNFDSRRLVLSAAANCLIIAFLIAVSDPVHLHARIAGPLRGNVLLGISTAAVAGLLLIAAHRVSRRWIGRLVQRGLRLVLRPGLFSNFERSRLLAEHIPTDALRRSPIRLIVTTTDLGSGAIRYSSNVRCEQIAADVGADPSFVMSSVCAVDTLMPAILASSALPIIFEPVTIAGEMHTDGGIAGSQPLQPAVRLGADVIFVVNLDPLAARRVGGKTFVDIGLKSLALMMSWSLVADIEALEQINVWCRDVAAARGVAAETVRLRLGNRTFRYVELFRIQPDAPLPGGLLDFGGRLTAEAVLRGYRDAAEQILRFRSYADRAGDAGEPQIVELIPAQ